MAISAGADISAVKVVLGHGTNLAKTSFAGLFPAKEPRYSICVFIHRPIKPTHSPKDLATSVVNELITWLMKY
nr:hypothetical protein [Prevotella sp.]